jgi:preprotein translocase subunit SecF
MFFVSMALTVAAIVVTATYGLRFGIDFKGGSVMEVAFEGTRPSLDDLNKTVSSVPDTANVTISPVGDKEALIRLNTVSEQTHQEILAAVTKNWGKITENRFDSIGPTVGKELRDKSIRAIIVLLLAVCIYLAFVFRKLSRVLTSWAVGLAAIAGMIHDVLIPIGVFALLGHFYGIEITAVYVAAALTILGYSISDAVVVFDRVRENVLRYGGKEDFGTLVHKSVMQTLVRSINTTLATILSLIAIYFWGGESIKFFSLALIIGIFSGSYSSIFVSAPILVWWSGKKR